MLARLGELMADAMQVIPAAAGAGRETLAEHERPGVRCVCRVMPGSAAGICLPN